MEKVSVILPAKNGELFIREATTSVLENTYKNLELVIIDNCSADSTLSKIKQVFDPRKRYYTY